LNPKPYIQNPESYTLDAKHEILNPKPLILNPESRTLNPEPS